jgi:hypothetical protein
MFANFKMPDITPAQISGVLGWIAAQAVAFGVIDTQRSQLLVSGGATIIATALKLSDALIRNGRAKIAVAQITGTAPVAVVTTPSNVTPQPPVVQ